MNKERTLENAIQTFKENIVNELNNRKNIEIEKVDGYITNKSFIDTRKELNYVIPDYEQMIYEMLVFMKSNKELYSQYFIKETCFY